MAIAYTEEWNWDRGDTYELNFKLGSDVFKIYVDRFEVTKDYTLLLNAYLKMINHEELIGEEYKLMVRNLVKWTETNNPIEDGEEE